MLRPPTALIAEDEPLLAQALCHALRDAWPDLHIAGTAGDGLSAVQLALQHQPDVLFLDIRMPGQSGLQAAAELAEDWPDGKAFPLLVFVSAYAQYALDAFETQALDYVLKPVRPDRLAKTVTRLQHSLRQRQAAAPPSTELDAVCQQLRSLLQGAAQQPRTERLQLLQASVGKQLHMVPVAEVLRFEAADKYVRVFTSAGKELLLRTPLKTLLQGLDPQVFWQIHRGSVVRASAIETVTRDEAGKLTLRLKGCDQALVVSRLYASQFQAM